MLLISQQACSLECPGGGIDDSGRRVFHRGHGIESDLSSRWSPEGEGKALLRRMRASIVDTKRMLANNKNIE